jgi:hypothetical protein
MCYRFLTISVITNIDIYNVRYTNKSENNTGHSSGLATARHPINARHFANRKHKVNSIMTHEFIFPIKQ